MWLWWLLAALVITAIAAVIVRRWLRPPLRPCLPQRYHEPPPEGAFAFRTRPGDLGFDRRRLSAAAQAEGWRAAMAEVGRRLERAGVREIVFVHGTFVGDDPTSLLEAMRHYLHRLSPDLERAVRLVTRTRSASLVGDTANYTPEYVEIFAQAIGGRIPCRLHVWPSANHHVARLRGAVTLAHSLAGGRGRALLIGHSHAGQLFALLTQLLFPSTTREALVAVAREVDAAPDTLEPVLRRASRRRLDFVAFGAPPRYGWARHRRWRLLNVVNHRGAEPRAGRLLGVLSTADGDYIQQWGIAGSDFPAGTARERELNVALDRILGDGLNIKEWLANVRHRLRVGCHGHTLLVDYGDQGGGLVPNCLETLFGHGVYTTYEAMLFNAELLVEHLYPPRRVHVRLRRPAAAAPPSAPHAAPPRDATG